MFLINAYILIGFIFGAFFVTNGYAMLEPEAKGSPIRFRLLLWPANLLLWPYLAWRIIKGKKNEKAS